MSQNNRNYVDDSGRILPHNQTSEWDDLEDDPEFSTYFSDQKVEIPSFPDDERVSVPYVFA
jgi:hypothetical protein